MERTDRRVIFAVTIVAGALLSAIGFALSRPADQPKSWKPVVEGFLAVPTPCCAKADLWDALETVTADGQRARPAFAAEAAQWLDDWPYRSRDDPEITKRTSESRRLARRKRTVGELAHNSAPAAALLVLESDRAQLCALSIRYELGYFCIPQP